MAAWGFPASAFRSTRAMSSRRACCCPTGAARLWTETRSTAVGPLRSTARCTAMGSVVTDSTAATTTDCRFASESARSRTSCCTTIPSGIRNARATSEVAAILTYASARLSPVPRT